jgi:hypothetical protein
LKPRAVIIAVVAAALAWPWLVAAAPRGAETAATVPVEFPGKPTGPIAVEHRRMGEPTVGVPLKIAVTARVEGNVGDLSINVNATVPRAALVTQPTLIDASEGAYAWEVTVVPLAADAGYLTVIVSGTIDGVDQARSVTIPLRSAIVDAAAMAEEGTEPLVPLPVQESP